MLTMKLLCIKQLKTTNTGNAFSRSYIEYESNVALSVKEYLDMIKPYLSSIINNYKIPRE